MRSLSLASRLLSGSSNSRPRLHDQGARQRHPLLLPAGELVRIAVVVVGEADDAELLFDELADLVLLMLALHLQRIGDVVEHGHMRPDGIGLEDHAEVPAVGPGTNDWVAALAIISPLMLIRPWLGCSNPAMQRRVVVLP